MKRGFTLIEILVVIAIIALLAAIIFPVLATARGKARAAVCQSNLKQLGTAMTMYIADYERYPYAVDPSDKYSNIWKNQKVAEGITLGDLSMLDVAMDEYIKNVSAEDVSDGQKRKANVWKCPSDVGFDHLEGRALHPTLGVDADWKLEGKSTFPSCFQLYGMSYFYRTELAFRKLSDDMLPNPAQTNVLFDADGLWHGSGILTGKQRRYNILYGDGHVKNVDYTASRVAWNTPVK